MGLAGCLGHIAKQSLVQSAGRVDHTRLVIETIDELNARLVYAQSAKRAFTVSGDDSYIVGHERWGAGFIEATARLRALALDNPNQRQLLDRLDPLLEERTAWLEEGIAIRRARGFDAALETANIRAGSKVTLEIDRLVDELRHAEHSLLIERQLTAERDAARLAQIQLGGLVVSVLIFGLTFTGLRRENQRRLRLEQVARDREQDLSITLNSIGDGVITTDEQARVTRMNPVAERLTGWKDDEAHGNRFGDVFRIINERTRGHAVDPVALALTERRVVGLENHTLLVARDGTERAIADSAAPIWNKDGQLSGVVMVFRDVEDERVTARTISEANWFLDAVIENIPNMIVVKNAADLRIVRFNAAGERLLDIKRDALLGKNDHDLFPPEQADALRDKDREVLAGDAVLDIPEEPLPTSQGTRWLHTRKLPIKDADRRPLYLLSISDDITERRRLADRQRQINEELEERVKQRTAALERSEQQLRQSQKMEALGRVAGGIAHDFNNLLSVILSYTEMLVERFSEDDPRRADLVEVHKAGKRAAELTRQLLAFSRQQVLTRQIIDLGPIVENMDKLLRRLIGDDIELLIKTAGDRDTVRVDSTQMEQVIMNLAVNARDAMPRGGRLTIETRLVDVDADVSARHPDVAAGRYVMLTMTDTGLGMDKATQSRIFEPFFTTKEVGKGTGLGLSTVFGIVRQSGGWISVESELGAGTAFMIFLPAVDAAEAIPNGVTSLPSSARPGSETILLVEDDDQLRAVARGILSRGGYLVLEAVNGVDALATCERFPDAIHLVITDVVMPRMNGRELMEALAVTRPGTKVLFMSGYTDDTVVHHGVLDEGLAFLQKPITPNSLLKRVREVLIH